MRCILFIPISVMACALPCYIGPCYNQTSPLVCQETPGHQQQWYWLCEIEMFLSFLKVNHDTMQHFNVKEWYEMQIHIYYTPAPPKVERGYTGFTLMSVRPSVCPSVRPSVRPSVGKVSATFRENYWLNSFHPWDLYLWGKSLDPYWFSCSCPHFWPSGGQKFTELTDSHQCSYHNDLKIGLFVGYFLMGWVLIRAGVYCPHLWAQLVFLPSISAQES